MTRQTYFVITFIILQHLYITSALECITTEPQLTRTFDTLLDLQADRRPFTPGKQGFEGNYIKFNFVTIDKIIKNAFITFDGEHIAGISLGEKNIQEIEDGAFLELQCLNSLDLHGNNLSVITQGIFQDLERLDELDLSENNLRALPAYVFAKMNSLRKLNLSRNHLTDIREPLSFFNLTSLQILDLSSNKIKFVSAEGLQELTKLKDFNLGSNQLRYPNFQKWDVISKTLQKLNIANNSVEKLDFNVNYTFSSMQILNISYNDLDGLDIHLLRAKFPMLESIDINHNRLPCDSLAVIRHELWDSKISYYGPENSAGRIDDITCRGDSLHPHGDPEQSSQTPSDVAVSALNLTSTYLKEIVAGNDRNTRVINQMSEKLARVENFVLYFYFVLVLCLAAIVVAKVGLCGRLYELMCERREREYLEIGCAENVPLTRRRRVQV